MSRDAISIHILAHEGASADTDAVHQVLLSDADYRRNSASGQRKSQPMFRIQNGRLQIQDISGSGGDWGDFSELDTFKPEWLAALAQHLMAGDVRLTVVGMPDDPSEQRTYAAYRLVPGQLFGGVPRAADLPAARLIAQNGEMLQTSESPEIENLPSWDDFHATGPTVPDAPIQVAERWVVMSTDAYARLTASKA